MDLTEWDENGSPHNGNHQNGHSQHPVRRSNGGSQDRYPDERRDLYQYRNGNVSREDFGEDMQDRRREGRRDNSVISNAVLNHLAGLHRRPVNRVRIIKLLYFNLSFIWNLFFRAPTYYQQLCASLKNLTTHHWKSLSMLCDVESTSWLRRCKKTKTSISDKKDLSE